MASGGSSGRASSGSRPFNFSSDDILCSYDDSAGQGFSNGRRSDPSGKDLHDSRMGRPLVNIYEQEDYSKENVLSAVEKCMKRYADNLLHSLEGISGRLSQLEIHCYKLERSIGEFKSEMTQDRNEEDLKFKSLENHLHEVHRSVQILRDKQELAETQKELTKLQLVQKESTQKTEESVKSSVSESKKHDDMPETANQLALVPSGQGNIPQSPQIQFVPPQLQPYKEQILQHPTPVPQSVRQDHYVVNQENAYYPQRQTSVQDQRNQTFQPEVQYMQGRPQSQDLPTQDPAQQPQMINQTRSQTFPQYQQQWPQQPSQQFQPQLVQPQQSSTQQLPPKVVQTQPPSLQAQIRPQAPPSYPPYSSYQPGNPVPETFPGSMAMQGPYMTIHQPGANRSEVAPLGYGGQGSTLSQQPTQHNTQGSFGPQLTKVEYTGTASYRPPVNVQGYNAPYNYSVNNVSPAHPPQLPSSDYGRLRQGQQPKLNHPYGDMIEKAISMGYPNDQVISVAHKMAESGQPMDVNVLLDRLNGGSAGAPPREW